LVPAFAIASMILAVAQNFAFSAASNDCCPPSLLMLNACKFNNGVSMLSKAASTGPVEST
jgi:hypothetical protein